MAEAAWKAAALPPELLGRIREDVPLDSLFTSSVMFVQNLWFEIAVEPELCQNEAADDLKEIREDIYAVGS